ncbi:Streptothricin acetyltransferase [Burkholderiaceae bacterium]|nr:Streptothricin acetyltransferase [Burkholderiaceae bacterium]
MSMSLVRLPPEAWPALAEFIVRCNRRPDGGVHCLHAAQGDDVASHAAELAALPPGEAAFWAVMEGTEQVGVVGCEFDPGLQRAWIRGPLASAAGVLDALRPMVGPTLESALPAIRHFDAFPSADDALLNEWYAAAGYEPQQLHRVLRAPIGTPPLTVQGVRRADATHVPAMLALHESLFPTAYLGEADFRRALGADDRALLVACGDDDAPIGYLHLQDNTSDQEAYIDYLGVMPAQRGRGIGRALLDAAAAWGAARGHGHLALTVREDRPTAYELYRRAGFVQISAGRHWRKPAAAAV